MNINKFLLWAVIACAVFAIGVYSYAYWKHKDVASSPEIATSTAHGKVAAASVEDGAYTVTVRSIMTSPEDRTITFTHVTYFEGAEATSSAKHEVKCDTAPLETCVPTLARGYYVRPSGAPEFTAPLTAQTTIVLKDKAVASLSDIQYLKRQTEPVFDVVIEGGAIVSLTEKSPV